MHDLVSSSRYRTTTCIVAERVHGLFDRFETADVPRFAAKHTAFLVRHAAELARRRGADIVVVHQHFQIAARLARALPGRVVFHAHGFYKSYSGAGLIPSIRRSIRLRELRRLAGLVHVSEACREHFAQSWPEVRLPQAVVYNGLDFSNWRPARTKRPEILCVGRCVPEKGMLEAAEAIVRVLPQRLSWRARIVLAEPDRNSDYRQQVEAVLTQSAARDQIDIERNIPWSMIKEHYEHAAIALVPSRWREPFGRTALEAHAGGAALVSSGTGGLREVSGSHALYVDPEDAGGFAGAINRLIDDGQLRAELAEGGARHARERFSIEAVAAANDVFYESLLRTGTEARLVGAS